MKAQKNILQSVSSIVKQTMSVLFSESTDVECAAKNIAIMFRNEILIIQSDRDRRTNKYLNIIFLLLHFMVSHCPIILISAIAGGHGLPDEVFFSNFDVKETDQSDILSVIKSQCSICNKKLDHND